MNERVKGVLFDLDGVLVDSVRAWHLTIDLGARRRGLPAVPWERFVGTFGQGVEADQRSFFPGLSTAQVSALYDAEFALHIDAVELMPGALDVLRELANRGLSTAVVTNTPRVLAEKVLEKKGLSGHIEALCAGGDAAEKPRPDLVQLALRRLDLSTADVVYVGDSAADAGATRAAGVRFIGMRYPTETRIERLGELLALLALEQPRTR